MMGVQEELERRRNEWRAAVNAGDLASYAQLVTTDLVDGFGPPRRSSEGETGA